MAGGLMQLVAYGAQDVYLTGNPKVTFFQAVYKRHTNFAMENIEQVVNGSASNDGRLSVTIARNGDLIGGMYLELNSTMTDYANCTSDSGTSIADTNWCAERAIKDVELTIGGQRIDKHYQKWFRLYSELYLSDAKKIQYGKMTSTASASGKVYLPLIFFFNRNPGLYLPLIALQYHEVRLDFDLGSAYQSYFGTTAPKVWGNYVYLDTEERRRFAQKGHEYLIEQVQHTGVDNLGTVAGSNTIRLSYNHPVKSLNWCYTEGSTTGVDNNLWNFSSSLSNVTVTTSAQANCTPGVAAGENTCLQMLPGEVACPHLLVTTNVALVGFNYWTEEGAIGVPNIDPLSVPNVGPLSSFKVVLNGQDRFKEQDGKYFNQVQPSYHNTGNPYPGIYTYSFALKPEEHQPTGTCNFSRIDNAQVSVSTKDLNLNESQHMFAVNYNVLRVQSGMGGLAFSN